jgi:hypothetical protein
MRQAAPWFVLVRASRPENAEGTKEFILFRPLAVRGKPQIVPA